MPGPDRLYIDLAAPNPFTQRDDAAVDGAFVTQGSGPNMATMQPPIPIGNVEVHQGSWRNQMPQQGGPVAIPLPTGPIDPRSIPIRDRGIQTPPRPATMETGEDPIVLNYQYSGHCPTCKHKVETLVLAGIMDDKVVAVAWCSTCKKKVNQQIVPILEVYKEVMPDAKEDGSRPEEGSESQGVDGEESGRIRIRDHAEDGVDTEHSEEGKIDEPEESKENQAASQDLGSPDATQNR